MCSRAGWGGCSPPPVFAKFLQNLPFLPQILAFLCLQPSHVPVSLRTFKFTPPSMMWLLMRQCPLKRQLVGRVVRSLEIQVAQAPNAQKDGSAEESTVDCRKLKVQRKTMNICAQGSHQKLVAGKIHRLLQNSSPATCYF